MSDDIDRIDNVAGIRREDSLNPMVRSKRQERREEKSDDDLTERSRKRAVQDRFVLEGDDKNHNDTSEPPVDTDETSEDEEAQQADLPAEEQDATPAERHQGIDLKI